VLLKARARQRHDPARPRRLTDPTYRVSALLAHLCNSPVLLNPAGFEPRPYVSNSGARATRSSEDSVALPHTT
jgi:hypothetical protein